MTTAASATSLSDLDFKQIASIAASEAGLDIPVAKKSLVQSRVARRMRALGFETCGDYLSSLENDRSETQNLISALTTNVSNFFREKHHFEYIRDDILSGDTLGRLRFWSAGCSNGQEPYSLAIEILKVIPDALKRDILILASDIDRTVLEKAASGCYSSSEIEGVPGADRTKFFSACSDGTYRVTDEVKKLVRFRALNLNGPPRPMQGPFDAVLCRNVVIYFNDETQSRLWPRFHALLRKGGLLMLGHSERLQPLEGNGFEPVGVTTYRKV